MMTYFAIPCCCCHMFGPNSVACCFSALFVILAGFAAVATVCDPTWRSVDQTLSTCLTGCCRWPVALCLLRFEENCVNNLSDPSKYTYVQQLAPATDAHQYIQGVAIKKPDSCSNPLLKKNQTIEMLSPSM